MKKNKTYFFLKILASAAAVIGASISLYLTLKAGHNNKSFLLVALFVIWVLSPFITLLALSVLSKHWSNITRITLYYLMIFVTVVSLIAYSRVLSPAEAKPAGIFLIMPLLSWLLILVVIPVASSIARRKLRK